MSSPLKKRITVAAITFLLLLGGWRTWFLVQEKKTKEAEHAAQTPDKSKSRNPSESKNPFEKSKKSTPVVVSNPIRGDIELFLEQTSTLESEEERKVFSQQSGIVTRVFFDIGDVVAPDSVLAELDDREIRLIYEKAEIIYNRRRMEYLKEEKIDRDKLSPDRLRKDAEYSFKNSRLVWDRDKLELARLKDEFARAKKSYKAGLISEQEYNTKDLEVKKQKLATRRAEIDFLKSEKEWKRVEKLDRAGLIENDFLAQTRNEFLTAENEWKKASLYLEQMKIPASMEGAIVEKKVEEGDYITPNTHLFTLSKIGRLSTKATIPERELPQLKIGQPVEATLEAIQSKPVYGKISRISPVVDSKSGTVEVTVSLNTNRSSLIRPGMFVKIRITTDVRKNALLIPKKAVLFDDLEKTLMIVVDGFAQKRVVETGFKRDEMVEALSGVGIGDQVIVQGQHGLADGTRVTIIEATR